MDGLMPEKKKLTDKPLAFKDPNESAIVGAGKPIVPNNAVVSALEGNKKKVTA